MIVRIYLLQLKPNETFFIEINELKSLYFVHLCWACSNDMHSQNVIVFMKNVAAGAGTIKNRFNTEMEAWY